MQPPVQVKEEVVSPADSSCENVFDRFELQDNRKLSCSSNESSSVSSTASSSDSGCYVSEYLDRKTFQNGSNETNQLSNANSSVVQKNLESHLSGCQKDKIQSILETVQKLNDTEKLLLYLKLPTRDQEHPITLSNTKQEQTLAFQWIRNNLEECDSSVNLPKHEVYDQYRANAESQGSRRYLSAPDFGKIVKCMFPNVKARRLGTRGNSKYCYNGLRKKVLKESPTLPDISEKPDTSSMEEKSQSQAQPKTEDDSTDQTFAAACVLVCEWANKLLGRFFTTLIELAKFLVGGSYVSTKSMAAFTVMSATQERIDSLNKRFSLEALVKSAPTSKEESAKRNKSRGKSVNTPMKTVMGAVKVANQIPVVTSPAQSVQVVPNTPTKTTTSVELSSNSKDSPVKLEECTVDVNAPVYLDHSSYQNANLQEAQQNVLMDDVNLIITDTDKNLGDIPSTNSICNPPPSQAVGTPKKQKRIPERIPISPQQNSYQPDSVPQSAPPISSNGYKTPKKVGRPRVLKKTNSSPYPVQSPRSKQQTELGSPRYQRNVLPPSFSPQMNANRFSGWNMPQPPLRSNLKNDLMSPVENELHNIFMSTRMNLVNQPPDLQRCQSVPVPQNNAEEIYKPLTPQVRQISTNMVASPVPMKAKRDLTSFFADPNGKEIANRNYQMDLMMKNRNNPNNVPFVNPHIHNERLVPTSYFERPPGNQGNSNSPFYANGTILQNRENQVAENNFHTMNDINSILNDLATPDELSDIPSSFEQVDSDELLNSLNTNENIWANEWTTATLPLMNV